MTSRTQEALELLLLSQGAITQTEAARLCGISQPTLSEAVSRHKAKHGGRVPDGRRRAKGKTRK